MPSSIPWNPVNYSFKKKLQSFPSSHRVRRGVLSKGIENRQQFCATKAHRTITQFYGLLLVYLQHRQKPSHCWELLPKGRPKFPTRPSASCNATVSNTSCRTTSGQGQRTREKNWQSGAGSWWKVTLNLRERENILNLVYMLPISVPRSQSSLSAFILLLVHLAAHLFPSSVIPKWTIKQPSFGATKTNPHVHEREHNNWSWEEMDRER